MPASDAAIAKVRVILADHLGVAPERVNDDGALLVADLGADSLDAIEIALEIEDELGIDLTAGDELEQVKSVGALLDLVRGKFAVLGAVP